MFSGAFWKLGGIVVLFFLDRSRRDVVFLNVVFDLSPCCQFFFVFRICACVGVKAVVFSFVFR